MMPINKIIVFCFPVFFVSILFLADKVRAKVLKYNISEEKIFAYSVLSVIISLCLWSMAVLTWLMIQEAIIK